MENKKESIFDRSFLFEEKLKKILERNEAFFIKTTLNGTILEFDINLTKFLDNSKEIFKGRNINQFLKGNELDFSNYEVFLMEHLRFTTDKNTFFFISFIEKMHKHNAGEDILVFFLKPVKFFTSRHTNEGLLNYDFLDNLFFGVGIIQDKIFVYVNKTIADLIRLSKNEILNLPIDEILESLWNKERAVIKTSFKKYQQKFQKEIFSNGVDISFNTLNSSVHLRCVKYPIQYNNKKAALLLFFNVGEKKKLISQLEDSNKKLEVLNRLIFLNEKTDNFNQIIRKIYDIIYEIFPYDKAGLYYIREGKAKLVYHRGLDSLFLKNVDNISISTEPYNRMFIDGEITIFEDITDDFPFYKEHELCTTCGIPIIHENKILGSINLSKKDKYQILDSNISILNLIGHEIGNLISKYEIKKSWVETESKFRSMINHLDIGFYRGILGGKLLYQNEILKKIIGLKESEEMLGSKSKDFFMYKFQRDEYYSKLFTKGNIEDFTAHIKRADGREGIVNINAHIIDKEENGKAIVEGTVQDITEKTKLIQKLKESEEIFRSIAEQSFLGLAIIQDFRFKYFNKTFREIFEYPLENLKKWDLYSFLNVVNEDDKFFVFEQINKNILSEKNKIPQFSFEFYTQMGKLKTAEMHLNKVVFKGHPADLITIIDKTDKKKAEQIIMEENERLSRINKMKDDFIRRVSHEFKTPLNSISSAAQVLEKYHKEELPTDIINLIEIMSKGTKRLEKLVRNILTISKQQFENIQLNLEETDIKNLLQECINSFDSEIAERNLDINFNTQISKNLYVDQSKFQQILKNIIENSIKNTPPGGIVNIKTLDKKEFLEIHVSDNGVGFTEVEKKHLFEKFGKTNRYGTGLKIDNEGPGLGLYLAKQLLEFHRAKIRVESEGRNKGSTFIISISKSSKIYTSGNRSSNSEKLKGL